MKTKPMKHQQTGCERLKDNPEFFALGAEQGTGKTWMVLADVERQFEAGEIDGLFVIAPKGVHVNWIKREIPKHLEAPYRAAFWLSGASKKHLRTIDRVFKAEDELAVLAMNVDAVNTPKGYAMAAKFLKAFNCMMIVDESQKIKSPEAKRSQKILKLGKLAKSRRIASGTLIADRGPLDIFNQFEFLKPGLLGTRSYRAFVAEYANLLDPNHPIVVEIKDRAEAKRRGAGARVNPQIVAKDHEGKPRFKNLDRLKSLMSPYTFRVLKKDCLDLPEKIYQTHFFDLSKSQQKVYEQIKEEKRYERDDGEIDIFTALTIINKLRQVTSGFVMVEGEATDLLESKPRLDALETVVEDVEGKVIVWASFREEIRQIVERLGPDQCVQYHGGVNAKDREAAIDSFQEGDAKFFVAHPAAGGTGLTLTAANTVVYYSCSFSLEERSQSEDRSHRFGTTDHVVYIDLVARDTVDEKIAEALQNKSAIATEILENL